MYKLFIILIIIYHFIKYINREPYTIYEIPNFLTDQECDELIKLSLPLLDSSNVYDGDTNKHDPDVRVSKQCWIYDNNQLAVSISDKIAKLTGQPKEHQEALQVVKYDKNGHFAKHYDACFGSATFCKRLNSGVGPRYMTVLIYLNDDYQGGGTSFPKIDQHIKPEKGKAIIFYNVNKDGTLIFESMHQGNKIESGTKWIANKWIRIPLNKN